MKDAGEHDAGRKASPERPAARSPKRSEIMVLRGDDRYRYSVGPVVEALQAAGAATEDAMSIGRSVERKLHNDRLTEVELGRLVELIAAKARELDDEVAERFVRQTPPFVPIVVGAGGEPLNRTRLTTSLERAGLDFKEAHLVAMQVEQALRSEGVESLDGSDLAKRVAVTLEGRIGIDARHRYQTVTYPSFVLRVQGPAGEALPYSRGILAQSLTAIGLSPNFSHNLAKRVETALNANDRAVVQRYEVREKVVELLRSDAGEEFAQRYLLLRQARRGDRPIVLMLGGAPGVGKSALASEIGYRLGIPRVVSTDIVREALRSLIGPDLSPILHASTYEAWHAELLPTEQAPETPDRLRVLRAFIAQVNQLKPALMAIAERNILEATPTVMEGVQLVPGMAPTLDVPGATALPLVLYLADEDDHRRHFSVREGQTGNRRGQQNYLDHFAEIRMIQEYLLERAAENGVATVEARDFDSAVESCVDHVLTFLIQEERSKESALSQARSGTESYESEGPPGHE